MIEPGIADYLRLSLGGLDAGLIDWSGYRVCPICRAVAGVACTALNGAVVGGQPDGVRKTLPRPHAARERRRAR